MSGHAIITGGSSGIGLALGKLLAKQGYALTLLARDKERLESAADLLQSMGAPVFWRSVDVSDANRVGEVINEAVRTHGPIQLAILSAGVAVPGYFEDLTPEIFENAMNVNYFGTLNCIRAALPHMKAATGQRHIVLISSGAGLVGIFGYGAYAPSKFAVRGLGEVLRAELVTKQIGVSVVYPPDTATPQLDAENLTKPFETRAITAKGGVWRADDVANAVLNGVRRRRFIIAPGPTMTLLAGLHSLLGPLLRRSFDRAAANARRPR